MHTERTNKSDLCGEDQRSSGLPILLSLRASWVIRGAGWQNTR